MANGGGENLNPAHDTFRKHSADLLAVIQDPEVLAWELYSESVVPSAVVEFANNMTHAREAQGPRNCWWLWGHRLRQTQECSMCFCLCSPSDPQWVTSAGEWRMVTVSQWSKLVWMGVGILNICSKLNLQNPQYCLLIMKHHNLLPTCGARGC